MAVGFRGLLSIHLGGEAASQGMLRGIALRKVLLTAHQVLPCAWDWNGSADAPLPHSALILPTDGFPLPHGGAALFLPATATKRIEWVEPRDVLVVWLPAASLGEVEEFSEGRAVAMSESRLVVSTRAFATAALRTPQPDSAVGAYSMQQLLSEMVLGLLLEAQGQVLLSEGRRSVAERARALMMARREDPELTSATIAAELHVSPRQLQREFARIGSSPSAELRHMRATLAEVVLGNPAHAMLGIAEVAALCGFRSPLHLRRALQACGLPGPRILRQRGMSAANDQSPSKLDHSATLS